MTWEFHFLDHIQHAIQSPFLDRIMPFLSALADSGFIWIVLTIILLCIKKYRHIGQASAISLIFMFLVGHVLLKPLVARPRPFDVNTAIQLLIEAPKDFSFPSGHTFASFACAFTLLPKDRRLGIPALVLAVLIAFSRMYLYVHYPTDVLGGILLGLMAALFARWLTPKLFPGSSLDQ